MATTELLPSPRPVTAEPIVVESSDSEDEREPQRKRRRTYSDESSSPSSENVIDLTEVDDHNHSPQDDQIRFNFLPKVFRLTPFKFSEDDDDDSTVVRLETLRDHLKSFFARPEDIPRDIGSPINPDELEIIGVKSSHSLPSSQQPPRDAAQRTTTASTSPSSSTSTTTSSKDKGKTAQSSSGEKEKENNGLASLECAVCLGPMKGTTATTCGHIFCLECIRKTIQVTKCCPLCKKKLTLKQIHPLYL